MTSARLTSAFARRSLAASSIPAAPPLGSFARRLPAVASTISSSSSSSSPSSSPLFPSSTRFYNTRASLFPRSTSNNPLSTSSRWSGVTSLNLTQSRKMAVDGRKIKVQNPVVELDGDEVCSETIVFLCLPRRRVVGFICFGRFSSSVPLMRMCFTSGDKVQSSEDDC